MIIAPVVANPKKVHAGSIVVITVETRTNAGVLTTPGTSYTIAIFSPTGSTAQAATTLTASAAGILTYTFATTTAMTAGVYTYEFVMTHTDGVSRLRTYPGDAANFELD